MYGPFPAAAAEQRLRDQVPALRAVGNAADLQTALKAQPAAVPAAFVLREERGDEPAGYSGGSLVQRIRVALIVVLWVRNYAAAGTGSGARCEMDALQTAVRTALVGWSPDEAFDVLNMQAERDEGYDGGNLVAQSIFRSFYRLQTEDMP
jgi:hypothetical protein